MKTTTKGLGLVISKEELEKLTMDVKESIAFGCTNHQKIFSAGDLWNIQRRSKTALRRRYN